VARPRGAKTPTVGVHVVTKPRSKSVAARGVGERPEQTIDAAADRRRRTKSFKSITTTRWLQAWRLTDVMQDRPATKPCAASLWERAREFHRGFCVVSPWCAAWVLRSGAGDRYAWERSHSGGKTAPSASFSATVRSIRTKLRLYALIPRREPSSGLPRSTATLSPSTQPTKLRPTSATRRVRASSMCRRYSARSPARYQDRVTTEEPAADITDTNLKEGGQLGFLV
jgi:hypothetical protein